MALPRRHHYLPKTYISAWTHTGTNDGNLQVLDKTSCQSWRTGPINAAIERDLYMLDISEVAGELAADEIESHFSTLESHAAPILRRIRSGADAVESSDRRSLMEFLSVLTFRVPGRLGWIDELLRKPVEVAFHQMAASGQLPMPDDPETAARIRALIENDGIRVKINQNALMAMMMQGATLVTDLLAARHWTVMRTDEGAGELICSDDPVILDWYKPVPSAYSPGFGLKNTVVFVPVGPSVALVGMWGAEPVSRLLSADHVCAWNGKLLGSVHRFAFARGAFTALHNSGALDGEEDVLRRWGALK